MIREAEQSTEVSYGWTQRAKKIYGLMKVDRNSWFVEHRADGNLNYPTRSI